MLPCALAPYRWDRVGRGFPPPPSRPAVGLTGASHPKGHGSGPGYPGPWPFLSPVRAGPQGGWRSIRDRWPAGPYAASRSAGAGSPLPPHARHVLQYVAPGKIARSTRRQLRPSQPTHTAGVHRATASRRV